jgi:hypothetical protein
MLHQFLDNLWRWKCGLPEQESVKVTIPPLEYLQRSEWSSEFEQLMRNRLVMGGIRYGLMGHGAVPKGKPHYSRSDSIIKRIQLFEQTGNAEYLVDVANFALLLFEERDHPQWHFRSVDDGVHDTIKDK